MNNKFNITLLSDPYSAHTVKWANGLFRKGIDIKILGISDYNPEEYLRGIKITTIKFPDFIKYRSDGNYLKLVYFFSLPHFKHLIKESGSTILHAHSASSYGLLGALSGHSPLLISVWGNDVFNFPSKGTFFKNLIKYNLSKADKIFSTSNMMAKETSKYTTKKVEVIPFGIDLTRFHPTKERKFYNPEDIVIGTIKSLEKKYGIIDLVYAFKIIKNKFPELSLKLLIVGRGSLEGEIKKLVKELNLESCTTLTGFVSPNEVEKYHNELDIFVAVSTEDSESFGVSILEASACEKPVIVSDKGGLKEVVENNITGIIVPANNPLKLADAMERLIQDKELSNSLGKAGRIRVLRHYDWENSLFEMIKNYEDIWEKFYSAS